MSKVFVDAQGRLVGIFVGAEPPAGSIEVPYAPGDGRLVWDGEAWVSPAPTAEELRISIANKRYTVETSGVMVGELLLDTSRDSQGLLNGAALAAYMDSTYTCRWKTLAGFIELDAQSIIAAAQAVRAHVQACFDREAALLQAVEDGEYTTDMLDTGWPV